MRTLVALLFIALASTPCWGQLTPTHSGLTYAVVGGTPLRLDLYLPTVGSAPFPCVVWIHGGGWQSGSRSPIPPAAQRLLPLGIAVASVDYRLTSQSAEFGGEPVIFPAQIHDVKGAVRWLRAHVAEYGLDPARFGSWGSSAGGHLSALLGTSGGISELEGTTGDNLDQSSIVQAFGDYFGPTDILHIQDMVTNPPGSTIPHDSPSSPESRLLGWDDPGQGLGDIKANLTNPNPPYPALVQLAMLANPIQHVGPDDPPAFVAHGTSDTSVPIGQSIALADAYGAAGLSRRWRPVTGAGHGFLGAATDSLAADFFRRVLFAEGTVGVDLPPERTSMLRARPNPSWGEAWIEASGFLDPAARALVFDVRGRKVRDLGAAHGGGWAWDGRDDSGRDAGSGVFFVRIAGATSSPAPLRIARISNTNY
jgi:acetyl esterase/lipase